jgi:hypothetical protein
MAEESAFQQRARELRQQRDEIEERDRAHYGEEEYQRRYTAKVATVRTLYERVNPLVEEARKRRFVYFRCSLDTGPDMSIRLQFADGRGTFYERSLSIGKVARVHGLRVSLIDAVEINGSVHNYVRGLEGIKMLSRGMTARRVRANGER